MPSVPPRTPESASSRQICFDLTHLVERMLMRAPSGIDKVDLAYARHFAARALGPALHYGLQSPHVLRPERMGEVVARLDAAAWERGARDQPHEDMADDAGLARIRAFLLGRAAPTETQTRGRPLTHRQRRFDAAAIGPRIEQLKFRVLHDGGTVPERAIYLNVAQLVLEYPFWFRWLDRRPDVTTVFLIHDLLPLDYPEFWAAGYRERFSRRMATATRYGRAFITTTDAVRQRLAAELRARGAKPAPIHVAPLPSSLTNAGDAGPLADAELSATPYFLQLGTIEPRKNHMLTLNLWTRMAQEAGRRGETVPKLVIVGARGWENEQVMDILDRSLAIRPHVIEAAGLSTRALSTLIANARAVLSPSFAEGYGLPIVEALSLGTPVIASDIPVFAEVSQGCAVLKHPLDGLGWLDTIRTLADPERPQSREARARAAAFRAPTWSGYFSSVEEFLTNGL